jgi:putative membrane protein
VQQKVCNVLDLKVYMRKQFKQFCLRWLVCCLALVIASKMFSAVELDGGRLSTIATAGFILALANTVIKPVVTVLSLPAIMLSLGLFTVIINGFMVSIAAWVYGPLAVDTFGAAVITGILVGILNFLMTRSLDKWSTENDSRA